jgi:hypothetical protein
VHIVKLYVYPSAKYAMALSAIMQENTVEAVAQTLARAIAPARVTPHRFLVLQVQIAAPLFVAPTARLVAEFVHLTIQYFRRTIALAAWLLSLLFIVNHPDFLGRLIRICVFATLDGSVQHATRTFAST